MRLVGFSGSDPIWIPEDRTDGEDVAAVIDRIYRERRERRVRAVIPYGEPLAIEDMIPIRLAGDAMRVDEYLDALNRRGVYVACRKIQTLDQGVVERAGL
jgi:hypothetical protein